MGCVKYKYSRITFPMEDISEDRDDDRVELVGHTTSQRNWRGIIIALVVIVAVCALIVTTIILLSPGKKDEDVVKEKFTFEDFMSTKYLPRSFRYTWLAGEAGFYHKNVDGAVLLFNCSTNSSAIIMDNSTFIELDASSFTISPDGRIALLPYNSEGVFRHSKVSEYKLFYLETRTSVDVRGPDGQKKLQSVAWSPTNNSLVFVLDNDIYYRPDINSPEVVRVTTSGVPAVIFNGIADWVYEEEILGTDKAIWWTADGNSFLYATFNDSEVLKYDLVYYGRPSNQYVDNRRLSYPKAGCVNPTVALSIYNTLSNTTVEIKAPSRFGNQDHYFTTVTWKDNRHVLITWLNRAQNFSIFTVCDATTGDCYENFEVQANSGWINTNAAATFSGTGHYFSILSKKEGDAGDFRHIAKIDSSIRTSNLHSNSKTFITRGKFDVTQILTVDDRSNLIYYLAYLEDDPTSVHLYRVSTENQSSSPECLSCTISDDCKYVSASFDDDVTYYVIACLGPGVPTYTLKSVSGDFERVLEDNADKQTELAKLALPRTRFMEIPLTGWPSMRAKLLLPRSLKEDEHTKYHMLIKVYGGPSSQQVTQKFDLAWEHYLSSAHNIIIGYIDSRGTAGRGDKWRHANYRHLGTTEIQDIITGARFLKGLKYVSSNTAVWGWSYGGFVTASILGQGTDAFHCGMSVAPVTDWRYYDSVYTERYMGQPTPDDNEAAYNFANVSRYAENFKNSRYFLAHGTGDDNVHFQNTAQFIRALNEADIYFRTQVYTDEQHAINAAPNARKHLYKSLEDFLLQCYGMPSLMDQISKQTITKDVDDDSS